MPRSPQQLRDDALAIWQAGVDAVRSDVLVQQNVRLDGNQLHVGDDAIDLNSAGRVFVVGAGKAGAGMAAGLEEALGPLLDEDPTRVEGWVNVPADCARPLRRITLHPARPAGRNEPTDEGVRGTREILRIVQSATERDVCLCLISGGGSALLPAPIEGITLADKQQVTRLLSGAGANIQQLNTVRKQLSRIKGGGLARACRAGRLFTLIISDVLGDPLDTIASGPTVSDNSTPQEALAVLEEFGARKANWSRAIFSALENKARDANANESRPTEFEPERIVNLVIGNNAVAVDAAGLEAERRGYSHAMHAATSLEGQAEDVGRHHAEMALRMRNQAGPDCLITGGEPVVQLADEAIRGRGGRSQQLVLAALLHLLGKRDDDSNNPGDGICLLSGGTDGEDGPTDAAGAFVDADVIARMQNVGLDPADYLRRSDAYTFLEQLDALIKTGPTHTNVCDVRVVVVDRVES